MIYVVHYCVSLNLICRPCPCGWIPGAVSLITWGAWINGIGLDPVPFCSDNFPSDGPEPTVTIRAGRVKNEGGVSHSLPRET